VDWEVAGGATRKTKTLFAHLLQKGGHGAATEELADLLWPEAESAEAARNWLYHTVKCLRDALEPGLGVGEGPRWPGTASVVGRRCR
jgi:two-component SAPR family response regulator